MTIGEARPKRDGAVEMTPVEAHVPIQRSDVASGGRGQVGGPHRDSAPESRQSAPRIYEGFRIAAIVPCFNEEAAIATVVRDLRRAVPTMAVFVYDNNSTDDTVVRARAAGAVVRSEPVKGKGNVVRRAFADIDADIYLLIDGDDTYDAAAAPKLIETLVTDNLDHVVGVRLEDRSAGGPSAYRPSHETGNKVLNSIVARIFGDSMDDMLSGYRVFSRRFVKSFPAASREFEIETELTVHSLGLRVPVATVPVGFKDRPEGSESKLRTYRDGYRILNVILSLARHERPLAFHGLLAGLSLILAGVLLTPVLTSYLETGQVDRFPTLFVGCVLVLIGSIVGMAGVVLDGIRKSRHEMCRLTYLRLPSVRLTEPAPSLVEAPRVAQRRHNDFDDEEPATVHRP